MQLTHQNTNFKKQKFPIILVCDNISNAPNIGSLFRTADTFGIEKLIFCGDAVSLGKRMSKTSRSTEKYVNYQLNQCIETVISNLKASNYMLLAIEITEASLPLRIFQIKTEQPIALIIGNENFGISASILKQCHTTLHINMYGNNSSMNVVQAASIALYELTKQLKG